MGRHSAPERPEATASVVRMTADRRVRPRPGGVDSVLVDLAAGGSFVDDLTLITADDQLLDRIAAGQGDVFVDPPKIQHGFPTGSLAPLLATWRSEILDPQWPPVPTAEQVARAVESERRPVVKPSRRALKPMLAVAVAISALLFSSAAVGARSATPGDALWPLTQVLYTARADSYAAGEAASVSLHSADAALNSGNPTNARIALTLASREMDRINLSDVKHPLQMTYDNLMSRVAVAARTESEQAFVTAADQKSVSGATSVHTSGAAGTARVPSAQPGTSTGTTPAGVAPVDAVDPGTPAPMVPGSPPTASGTSAPVTAPPNPSDPAPSTTGPIAPVPSGPGVPTSPGPPVITNPVTTNPVTTNPVTTNPVTTNPVTTNPVTTNPVTTDPRTTVPVTGATPTDPSTGPVTTQVSTTSQLPTPTPTPTPTQDPGAGAHGTSIGPAGAAGQ